MKNAAIIGGLFFLALIGVFTIVTAFNLLDQWNMCLQEHGIAYCAQELFK